MLPILGSVAVLTRHGIRLGLPRLAPILVALVFFACLAALTLLRGDEPRPAPDAEAAALGEPSVRSHLARRGFDRVVTASLDSETTRVAFFDGPRIVLEVAVPTRGEITNVNRYEDGQARLGSNVGQTLPVLAVLLLAFLLAVVRLPLKRIENLDSAALAAFVVPIVLLNERYVEWSVTASAVLLVYLVARCAGVALAPGRDAAGTVRVRRPAAVRRRGGGRSRADRRARRTGQRRRVCVDARCDAVARRRRALRESRGW